MTFLSVVDGTKLCFCHFLELLGAYFYAMSLLWVPGHIRKRHFYFVFLESRTSTAHASVSWAQATHTMDAGAYLLHQEDSATIIADFSSPQPREVALCGHPLKI